MKSKKFFVFTSVLFFGFALGVFVGLSFPRGINLISILMFQYQAKQVDSYRLYNVRSTDSVYVDDRVSKIRIFEWPFEGSLRSDTSGLYEELIAEDINYTPHEEGGHVVNILIIPKHRIKNFFVLDSVGSLTLIESDLIPYFDEREIPTDAIYLIKSLVINSLAKVNLSDLVGIIKNEINGYLPRMHYRKKDPNYGKYEIKLQEI